MPSGCAARRQDVVPLERRLLTQDTSASCIFVKNSMEGPVSSRNIWLNIKQIFKIYMEDFLKNILFIKFIFHYIPA